MTPEELAALPASLRQRPFDLKRKLPIPLANTFPDGSHDFTVVNGQVAFEAARGALCGLCGARIGWDPQRARIAFLGGPGSAEAGTYSDPPMHVACAEAATRLCPHIARPTMSRAPEGTNVRSPKGGASGYPDGWVGNRPQAWVMNVCRSYKIELHPAPEGGHHAIFRVEGVHEHRWYEYDDDGVLRHVRTVP